MIADSDTRHLNRHIHHDAKPCNTPCGTWWRVHAGSLDVRDGLTLCPTILFYSFHH
jgi:hypothetical protein